MEIWKDIIDYVGYYQVSNYGNIRSLDRVSSRVQNGKTVLQPLDGAMFILNPGTNGYITVSLTKNGIIKRFYVHELVMTHFTGERPNSMQICHLNGIRCDNNVFNLRYDTPIGNALDRHLHGTDAKGVNNPMAILNEEQVKIIKNMLISKTIKQVSETLGINYSTIRNIKNGSNWNWLII